MTQENKRRILIYSTIAVVAIILIIIIFSLVSGPRSYATPLSLTWISEKTFNLRYGFWKNYYNLKYKIVSPPADCPESVDCSFGPSFGPGGVDYSTPCDDPHLELRCPGVERIE